MLIILKEIYLKLILHFFSLSHWKGKYIYSDLVYIMFLYYIWIFLIELIRNKFQYNEKSIKIS